MRWIDTRRGLYMKFKNLVTIVALGLIVYAMTNCMATTKTTTTYPDGRVEVVEQTAPAPGSVETAGALAQTAAQIAAANGTVHYPK